jgi:anti-sigma regulatory factor (Ser/Thr protein kinase)
MDPAVRIHRVEHVDLFALLSSAGRSRVFVRGVCASWQLEKEPTDVAELLASELVSNAVTASGVTRPRPARGRLPAGLQLIGLRLLALDDSLVIEVQDTSLRLPRLLDPAVSSEHGRGLQLVDALSTRWGCYQAHAGGKVVWCQLALSDGDPGPGTGEAADAFERVLEALESRPWDKHA